MPFSNRIRVLRRADCAMASAPFTRTLSMVVSVATLCAPTTTLGESGQHRAHVHGVAEITLAVEGSELEIVLTSPADSILGFEHKAASEAQLKAVEEARTSLKNATELFTFTGTQCELRHAAVDVSAVLEGDEAGDNDHDHHDEHDDEDSHASHDGHDEGEDHHGHDDEDSHGKETHSDVSAHYEYRCGDGAKLEAVQVGSSGLPFGIQTINAMWVTDSAQGATELTADNQLIKLR